MDVAPDRDFLSEFIDSFDKKEEKDVEEHERVEMRSSSSSSVDPDPVTPSPSLLVQTRGDEEKENENDVWLDIEDALHQWTGRILDAETRHARTASFRENIADSLQRQQLDGFLNHHDIAELMYIADLWTNLLNATSSYTIGCEFAKRDVITCLLELYKLRQITDCLFIEACLKL